MTTLDEIKGLVSDLLSVNRQRIGNSAKTDTITERQPISGDDVMGITGRKKTAAIDSNPDMLDDAPELEESPAEIAPDAMDDDLPDADIDDDLDSGGDDGTDLDTQIFEALSSVLVNNPDLTPEELIDHLKTQIDSDAAPSALDAADDVTIADEALDDVTVTDEDIDEVGGDEEEDGDKLVPMGNLELFSDGDKDSDTEDGDEDILTEKVADDDEAEDAEEGFGDDEAVEYESDAKDEDAKDEDAKDEDEDAEDAEDEDVGELKVSFTKSKDPSKCVWTVKRGDTPVMKVSAKQAFGDMLPLKPEPGEYPRNYKSYGDVFTSKDYGTVLLHMAKTSGIEKACSAASGTLLKAAQVGPGSVQPYGGPGVHASEPQPFMQGTTAGLEDQPQTEGGDDTNFNPSDAAEKDMLEGAGESMLVSDELIAFLSILIANRQHSIDDVMNELAEIFSDEGSMAEFRGALKEHAEILAKGSTDDNGQETDGNLPDVNFPPDGGVPFGGPEGMAGGPQDDMGLGEPGMKTSSTKDDLIEYLLNERTARMKLASRVEFVRTHMQNRGPEGTPLVPSVDYLVNAEGLSKEAATQKELELTYGEAKKLMDLDESGWQVFQDAVMRHPVLHTASVSDNKLEKTASSQSNNAIGIYMENDPPGGKYDNALPEELFETRYSKIARAANAARKTGRRVFP